jgi:hypothetical protein
MSGRVPSLAHVPTGLGRRYHPADPAVNQPAPERRRGGAAIATPPLGSHLSSCEVASFQSASVNSARRFNAQAASVLPCATGRSSP